MPIFWTLFWLGAVGFPLMVLLAYLVRSKDGGFEKDTSHIWVTYKTHSKVKDATIRDVWEHNHPGKKWGDHQTGQFIGCSVFLGIIFLIFMIWLTNTIFLLPQGNPAQRLFRQIGAPILGGLTAAAFIGLESLALNMKSSFLKVLNYLTLAAVAILLILLLIFTFIKRPLPFSQNWMWAVICAPLLFLLVDAISGKKQKTKASKGGAQLEEWAWQVIRERWGYSDVEKKVGVVMQAARIILDNGEYDTLLYSDQFNQLTESLMLDLIQGRSMSIKDEDVYNARSEVIETLQAFYLYGCRNIKGYQMHPRIKAAMEKKR
jgi:hypothetical protein